MNMPPIDRQASGAARLAQKIRSAYAAPGSTSVTSSGALSGSKAPTDSLEAPESYIEELKESLYKMEVYPKSVEAAPGGRIRVLMLRPREIEFARKVCVPYRKAPDGGPTFHGFPVDIAAVERSPGYLQAAKRRDAALEKIRGFASGFIAGWMARPNGSIDWRFCRQAFLCTTPASTEPVASATATSSSSCPTRPDLVKEEALSDSEVARDR
jgi:hypothetical protein